MKRLVTIGIASLAAGVVLFAAFHYIRAQGSPKSGLTPPSAAQESDLSVPSVNVPHILVATYFTQALNTHVYETWKGEESTGWAVDKPTTIKCPWPGCTLEIEQTAQVGDEDYTTNGWGLGVLIDGTTWLYTSVGDVPSDGNFAVGTSDQSTPLTPGKHTVQSFIWSYDGLYLGAYHMNYRVYVP
jgi:hypothetical protein